MLRRAADCAARLGLLYDPDKTVKRASLLLSLLVGAGDDLF